MDNKSINVASTRDFSRKLVFLFFKEAEVWRSVWRSSSTPATMPPATTSAWWGDLGVGWMKITASSCPKVIPAGPCRSTSILQFEWMDPHSQCAKRRITSTSSSPTSQMSHSWAHSPACHYSVWQCLSPPAEGKLMPALTSAQGRKAECTITLKSKQPKESD